MRTFVAIELAGTLLGALTACLSALQRARPPLRLRWVPPQNQHLTLQFLGEVAEADGAAIAAALSVAVKGCTPFELALNGLGCFPSATRPNVLWVGVHEPAGALARLQQSVAAYLAPLGFEPERGPFQPHLTLARLPRDAAPADRRALGQWFMRQAAPAPAAMRVTVIHLMRSDLVAGAHRYTPLAAIALPEATAAPLEPPQAGSSSRHDPSPASSQ